MHIMQKLFNFVKNTQELCTLCKITQNFAKSTQKVRKNMQKLRKITLKKLRENYEYVCKLHNLHYYAPPTLLMMIRASKVGSHDAPYSKT